MGPGAILRKISTKGLERSFDRLKRAGYVAPDINRERVVGTRKVSADPSERLVKIPTDERGTDISDYLRARMGEGDLNTSTILHENDHLRPASFWDDRAQMRAYRAQNLNITGSGDKVMVKSPALQALQDDAVRSVGRLSPSDTDLQVTVNQLEALPYIKKNIIGHDYDAPEILADSAARFEGHQRKLGRTGQLPIGDRGWMQELAVASTAGDRMGSIVEAMRSFAQNAKKRYPNMTEGKVPVQGKLF